MEIELQPFTTELNENDEALRTPASSYSCRRIGFAIVGLAGVIACTTLAVQAVFPQTSKLSEYEQRPLIRYELEDPELTCNDGTPAVYYLRKSSNPAEKRWIVRFEGGGSCGHGGACEQRWRTRPQDMTTKWDPELIKDANGGILCNDPDLNPHYWDWNVVWGHYCSSDSWMGRTRFDDEWNDSRFAFMGAYITQGILDALIDEHGMSEATQIVIGSMSVATTGTMNFVDMWVPYFQSVAPLATLKLIADSGWTLYGWSYYDDMAEGSNGQYRLHNPVLNQNCVDAGYTWQCYYPAQYLFPLVDEYQRIIVVQQMFDKMELPFPMGDPYESWDEDMMTWAIDRAEFVVGTIRDQTEACFVSNCRSHDTIDKYDFNTIHINDMAIMDVTKSFVDGNKVGHVIDEELLPEKNPTCTFDQLEWNIIHCGQWWISDC